MAFNSYVFLLSFLPISVVGYFGLAKFKSNLYADVFLICSSLIFYGYYHYGYVVLLAISILINYVITYKMRERIISSKKLMLCGVIGNLGILFIFKYYNFFIDNINILVGSSIKLLTVMLPVGISFYTFQQISYIVDIYNNPEISGGGYNLLEYAKYVTFFPYILQGPIAYHHEIIPQFRDNNSRKINYYNLSRGLWLFAVGMGKKVIIADSLGILVDDSFLHIGELGALKACITMISYTLQIYFDFSGYCDMASGIAKMFNVNLPLNFDSPYRALNIVEFWKRWHITLTRFFTKYVYIPLGGNRKGKIRTYFNIIVIFLISGLWHGANWTFISWGLAHGIASIITRILKNNTKFMSINKSIIKRVILWGITFIFVNFTWILFRADSVSDALAFYKQIFSLSGGAIDSSFMSLVLTDGIKIFGRSIPILGGIIIQNWLWLLLGVALFISVYIGDQAQIKKWKPSFGQACVTVIILVYCILSFEGVSSFLYWNF